MSLMIGLALGLIVLAFAIGGGALRGALRRSATAAPPPAPPVVGPPTGPTTSPAPGTTPATAPASAPSSTFPGWMKGGVWWWLAGVVVLLLVVATVIVLASNITGMTPTWWWIFIGPPLLLGLAFMSLKDYRIYALILLAFAFFIIGIGLTKSSVVEGTSSGSFGLPGSRKNSPSTILQPPQPLRSGFHSTPILGLHVPFEAPPKGQRPIQISASSGLMARPRVAGDPTRLNFTVGPGKVELSSNDNDFVLGEICFDDRPRTTCPD